MWGKRMRRPLGGEGISAPRPANFPFAPPHHGPARRAAMHALAVLGFAGTSSSSPRGAPTDRRPLPARGTGGLVGALALSSRPDGAGGEKTPRRDEGRQSKPPVAAQGAICARVCPRPRQFAPAPRRACGSARGAEAAPGEAPNWPADRAPVSRAAAPARTACRGRGHARAAVQVAARATGLYGPADVTRRRRAASLTPSPGMGCGSAGPIAGARRALHARAPAKKAHICTARHSRPTEKKKRSASDRGAGRCGAALPADRRGRVGRWEC